MWKGKTGSGVVRKGWWLDPRKMLQSCLADCPCPRINLSRLWSMETLKVDAVSKMSFDCHGDNSNREYYCQMCLPLSLKYT